MRTVRRTFSAMALVVAGCTFGSSGSTASGGAGDPDASSGGGSSASASTSGPQGTTMGSASAEGDATTAVEPSASSTGPGDTTGTDAGSTGMGTGDDGGEDSSTGTPVTCSKALWVLGNVDVGQTADGPFYERLVTAGWDITLVQNAVSSTADVADNCLVILSAVGSSGDVGAEFRDVTVPVVVMEAFLYDEMEMAAAGSEAVTAGEGIEVVDAGHPMAAGLSGFVDLYLPTAEIGFATVEATAQVVATLPSTPASATIFGYPAGAAMAGISAPARRVGFPASGANTQGATADGVDLFEAAVAWAVQ